MKEWKKIGSFTPANNWPFELYVLIPEPGKTIAACKWKKLGGVLKLEFNVIKGKGVTKNTRVYADLYAVAGADGLDYINGLKDYGELWE